MMKKLFLMLVFVFTLNYCSFDVGYDALEDKKNISYKDIVHFYSQGIDFSQQGFTGKFPLEKIFEHYNKDSFKILQFLKMKKVNLFQNLRANKTILNYIVQYKPQVALPMLRFLLKDFKDTKFLHSISNPLVEAVRNKYENITPMVQYLLSFFSIDSVQTQTQTTPLMSSVLNPTEEGYALFELILNKKPSVATYDKEKQNIFHYLAMSQNPKMLKMLEDLPQYYKLLDQPDSRDHLPIEKLLKYGEQKNILQIVQWFLHHESKTTFFSQGHASKLLIAAAKNKTSQAPELAKLILKLGGFVNFQDSLGCSPLFYATINSSPRNVELVNLLIAQGASVYIKNNKDENVLFYAVLNPTKRALHIIKILTHNGLSLFIRIKGHNNLLHYAVQNIGKYADAIVKYLLENNINVKIKNTKGFTPLMLAALNTGKSSVSIVQRIVERGYQGKLDSMQDGSPILSAVQNPSIYGYTILVNLVKNGFNLNVENNDGQNTLVLATQNEGVAANKIVHYLVLKSIYLNHQDKYGNTALIYAFYNKKHRNRMIKYLLIKGASPYIKNSVQDNLNSLISQTPPSQQKYLQSFVTQLYSKSKSKIEYQVIN